MRAASPAATRPMRCACSRSPVSSNSSQGLAIAKKQAATRPPSRCSIKTSGAAGYDCGSPGAAAARCMLILLLPANLDDCRLEARIQIEALQLGERARAVGRPLLVLLEPQAEPANVAQFDAELYADRRGRERGEPWVR